MEYFSAEKIAANYDTLRKILASEHFSDRYSSLKLMYDELEIDDRIIMAPASATEHFHNSLPGGYVDHILRVFKFSLIVYDAWEKAGFDLSGFTKSELLFVALHHDLGKLGFPGDHKEYYQLNDSKWHRENRGQIYKTNPAIPHSKPFDRTMFMLNYYGVKLSFNEMLGIRLADGMYDDDNKYYLITYEPQSKLKNQLPYIIHQADLMAARFEYDRWAKQSSKVTTANNIVSPKSSPEKQSEFDKLFS